MVAQVFFLICCNICPDRHATEGSQVKASLISFEKEVKLISYGQEFQQIEVTHASTRRTNGGKGVRKICMQFVKIN